VEGKSNFFESKELVKAVAAPPPNPWKMVAICSSFLYGWKGWWFSRRQDEKVRERDAIYKCRKRNEREKEGAKKLRDCRKEKESKLWFLCFFFGTTKLINSNTNIVCIATSIARLVSTRVRKKLFHLYYLSLFNPLKSNNIEIIFNEHLLDIHWDVRDGMSCNVRDFFFFFFSLLGLR